MSIYPTVRPSLTLDFQKSKQLDPRITFSRSSSATYVEGGVIKYADEHQARFEDDGLLIEERRTNSFLQSKDFSSSWGATFATKTLAAGVAPDGTTTACKLTPDGTFASHYMGQTQTVTTASFSVFAKADGYDYARVYIAQGWAQFNLVTGTVVQEGTIGIGSIEPFPDGWYRLKVQNISVGTATNYRFYSDESVGDGNYAGDGVSGTLFWGAQLEDAAFSTSYIPTAGSEEIRSADIAQITGDNFSSWYNQGEGTVQVKYSSPTDTSLDYKRLVSISNSSSDSMSLGDGIMYGSHSPSTSTRWMARNGASIWYAALASPVALSSAIAYKDDDLAISYDGATVITNNSYTISTLPSRLDVYPNGHISRISCYPERLTNEQLEAITS